MSISTAPLNDILVLGFMILSIEIAGIGWLIARTIDQHRIAMAQQGGLLRNWFCLFAFEADENDTPSDRITSEKSQLHRLVRHLEWQWEVSQRQAASRAVPPST
jgi:hypothetical protein